jgi:hypothetical protein
MYSKATAKIQMCSSNRVNKVKEYDRCYPYNEEYKDKVIQDSLFTIKVYIYIYIYFMSKLKYTILVLVIYIRKGDVRGNITFIISLLQINVTVYVALTTLVTKCNVHCHINL